MYRPNYTIPNNDALCAQLVRDYPLGMVITIGKDNKSVETSYLPFIVEASLESEDTGTVTLTTHMSKANPHAHSLNNSSATVTFQGTSRYISPELYADKLNVPTWNYAVAQFIGTAQIVSDPLEIDRILASSVDVFETKYGHTWQYALPARFKDQLLTEIVGLKIKIENIFGKFKLSQNRSEKDYDSVRTFLAHSSDPKDKDLLLWMNLAGRPKP